MFEVNMYKNTRAKKSSTLLENILKISRSAKAEIVLRRFFSASK